MISGTDSVAANVRADMNVPLRVALFVIVGLLVAACATGDPPSSGEKAGVVDQRVDGRSEVGAGAGSELGLVGTLWVVDDYVNGSSSEGDATPEVLSRAEVTFDPDGYVRGNDGCNSFGAGKSGGDMTPSYGLQFAIDGQRMSFSGEPLTTTRACGNVDSSKFWAVLTESVEWKIEGSQLTLLDEAGDAVTYQAIAES